MSLVYDFKLVIVASVIVVNILLFLILSLLKRIFKKPDTSVFVKEIFISKYYEILRLLELEISIEDIISIEHKALRMLTKTEILNPDYKKMIDNLNKAFKSHWIARNGIKGAELNLFKHLDTLTFTSERWRESIEYEASITPVI